jgi:hypothetical protein
LLEWATHLLGAAHITFGKSAHRASQGSERLRPGHEELVARCHAELEGVCDPLTVDAQARRRQSQVLAKHGGREAVIARGDFGFSPPPGIRPEFQKVLPSLWCGSTNSKTQREHNKSAYPLIAYMGADIVERHLFLQKDQQARLAC